MALSPVNPAMVRVSGLTGALIYRWPDLEALVSRRWVVHLRASPSCLQPLMGFVPVRLAVAFLIPMDQSGFVAPLEELSHHLPMRAS